MQFAQKISFLTALFLAAVKLSFGQSYSISPNDSIVIKGMMEDMETLTILQVNETKDTINLAWRELSESVPENWDASVCDNKICYTSLVKSGTMNPVGPEESSFILLHITPHVNFGTAVIRYLVWDIENPSHKDTLTYILIVENASGIDEIVKKNDIKIYPSPASDHLNIVTSVIQSFNYQVVDIAGREVLTGFAENNSATLVTSNLPAGIYTVLVTDNKNNYIAKKITVQH